MSGSSLRKARSARRALWPLSLILLSTFSVSLVAGLLDMRVAPMTGTPPSAVPRPNPAAVPSTPTPQVFPVTVAPRRPRSTSTTPGAPAPRPAASGTIPRAGKGTKQRKYRGTVYLTFDDGPSIYTPAVLDILRRTNSTATFFQLGMRREQFPRAAARIRREGSNIGNHTYDHPNLTLLSPQGVRRQLQNGPRSRCARPPYGATSRTVRRAIRRLGAREVLWTADTLDWTQPGVARIVARATSAEVKAGSIILMHDGGGAREQTVAALPSIITSLQQRHLRVRRLPGC